MSAPSPIFALTCGNLATLPTQDYGRVHKYDQIDPDVHKLLASTTSYATPICLYFICATAKHDSLTTILRDFT